MRKYQTTSMERIACTGVGDVALGDKLWRSPGVDWAIQNWVLSARNAPLRGGDREEGREGFSG